MSWYRKKEPEPKLLPQTCQCGHLRCAHVDGNKQCCAGIKVDDGRWAPCACQIFIPIENLKEKSEIEALERMYKQ